MIDPDHHPEMFSAKCDLEGPCLHEAVRIRTAGLGFSQEDNEVITLRVEKTLDRPIIKFFFGPRIGDLNIVGILCLIGFAVCAYFAVKAV